MSYFSSFNNDQKKTLFLSSLGGVLEFYDFIIYIFLAPIIEQVFFASSSTQVATLKTLAVFSMSYLLRPLGGLLFSHFGDRYGRKVVFFLTVFMMAIPSFAIALLPTPQQIGLASPILLLVFRMMQGLAVGGEIPAAITFVSEHSPLSQKGFSLACLFFGINIGLLLGSLITTMVTTWFTSQNLLSYGWRIPFLIGGVFGLGSIWVRKYLKETKAFIALKQEERLRIPLMTLLNHFKNNVLQGFFLVALGSISIFLFLYEPQYLYQNFHYDYLQLMRINTFAIVILNLSILGCGLLVDRYGARSVYIVGSIFIMLFTYPLFLLFSSHYLSLVILSSIGFALLFGFIPSAYCVLLSSLFPTPVRYSGVALSYNLAFAIFGGLSPIVCTLIIEIFRSPFAVAFYIILVTLSSCWACFMGRQTKTYPSTVVERWQGASIP